MTWISIGVLVLLGVAGLALRWMMSRPLFEPGTAAARVQAAGEQLDPPAQPSGSERWQVTEEIALYHVSLGAGEDLVLVHGGPGFPPLAPWRSAALLARSFRVHTYHQRGCGQSTRPFERAPGRSFYEKLRAVEGKLGLAEQIADLERIRRILGRDRMVVIGHSFGALIASLYAAEFPEHVRALVLVAPANLAVMPKDGPDLFALLRERLPPGRQAAFDDYLRGYFDLSSELEQDEATLSRQFGGLRSYYAEATGSAAVKNDGDAGGMSTAAVYASLGRRHDWRSALAKIQAPTLVLQGSDDLQPESDSRSFAGSIPNARVEVVPHAGHFLPDDSPEAFASIVERFLAGAR